MLVMFPGQKPSMVRVDQLSYAWSQDYKRREFVKFRYLLANTTKPSNNKHFEPVLVCCGFFLTVRYL